MSSADEPDIKLELSRDSMRATLQIPVGASLALEGDALCIAVLHDRGVSISASVEERIAELVELHRKNPDEDHEVVVAEGREPIQGDPERLELSQLNNNDGEDQKPEDEAVSYYECSALATITVGDQLGKLIPATDGEDGVNVLGETIPARRGRTLGLHTDDSIEIRPDGVIIARRPGILEHSGSTLRVTNMLTITTDIDFSTGNISFDGDVTIHKVVNDCFVIEATGSIHVHGAVQAATIKAGVDANLEGGVAGRDKAVIEVGRDLCTRYIEKAQVTVARNLEVLHEIVCADILVQGKLIADRCSIVGASVHVCGRCQVGTIGGERAGQTHLTVGRLKGVNELQTAGTDLLPKITAKRKTFESEYSEMKDSIESLTPTQAERMTELEFTLATLDGLTSKIKNGLGQLTSLLDEFTELDLIVQSIVHAGVLITIGPWDAHITMDMKGPLRFTVDETGSPIVIDLVSETSTPLENFARIEQQGAALDSTADATG